jgi:hypothetical protein
MFTFTTKPMALGKTGSCITCDKSLYYPNFYMDTLILILHDKKHVPGACILEVPVRMPTGQ